MSKPTIVMVPGAWHKPDIYSGVASSLEKHGYPTVSLALPSAGAKPSHQDFSGDVSGIRECLTELVSAGKEVILVVHSYTGLPGGEAPKGLSKKDQEAKDLKGGLIRYVVINGFATPPGFQIVAKGDYAKMPDWMKLDTENEVFTVEPEDAKRIFYNDLAPDKHHLIPEIVPQSFGVYFSVATYAAWLDVPSTFLYGEMDQSSFTPEVVDMMIKGAQMMNPSAFDVVERLKDGGHCLMISHPEWTAEALRRAAGEKF
ncbi:hypothetical protein NHQ30_008729 [Ciborinia camelliae]|nr:hypothetical protein NHQ30_008729 [Ciborinia camelliae]